MKGNGKKLFFKPKHFVGKVCYFRETFRQNLWLVLAAL